jgi:hypothetical protein
MRVVGLAAILGVLCISTGANADVNGVVTDARADLQFDPIFTNLGANGEVSFAGHNESGLVTDGETSTGSYSVTSQTLPNYIAFANGATASGELVSVTTTTSIAITFTNTGLSAVRPQLVSTIDPAGLGFYLSNTQGCDPTTVSACPQVGPGSATFDYLGLNPDGSQTALGGASVSLTISDNFSTLESLNASVELDNTVNGTTVATKFSDSAMGLNGFGLSALSDKTTLVGYQWDSTDLLINFPTVLAPGASDTLIYTTTVNSYITNNCDGNCALVAYAGFGDPIGKGGGGGNVQHHSSLRLDAPSGVQGVGYDTFGFGTPIFEDGELDLPAVSPAPEPAAWGLMLTGFGCVGGVVRRRSRRLAA